MRSDDNLLLNYFVKDVSNCVGAECIITTKSNERKGIVPDPDADEDDDDSSDDD